MSKRVLFVAYGGGHVHMITAVSKSLRQCAPQVQQLAVGLPTARAALAKAGLDVIGFEDVLDPINDADALEWGGKLAETHHASHTGIPYEVSVAYLGLSFKDFVLRHGLDAAWDAVARDGRNAFYPLTVMERLIPQTRPDIVVATNSPRAEAAALAVARRHGLPTVAMVDLFTGMRDYRIKADDIVFLNQVAHDSCHAMDILPPPGTYSAHLLGNPAFDNLLSRRAKPDPIWLDTVFPQRKGRPVVLFADMPAWVEGATGIGHLKTDAETLLELDLVWRATRQAGAFLAIRPHPSQRRHAFEDFIARHEGTALAAAQNLEDLLERVHLVVARSTTVALQACFLRQKVLQIEPARHTDMPVFAMGLAAGTDNLNDLGQTVTETLRDTQAHRLRVDMADRLLPSTPASDQIAELIRMRLASKG